MLQKIKVIVTAIVLALLPAIPALAKSPIRTIDGIVTRVSDGDTVHVRDDLGTKLKVRLYGVDAPETPKANKKTGRISKPGQPYGEEAWRALEEKVFRKRVRLEVMDIDRYKRLVSLVWLDKQNINEEMVAEGWAWAYKQYLDTPYASQFIGLEAQARAKRLGLWQQNNPQPPWEFRKSLKRGKRGRAAW